jgi:hypothetical protein
MRIAWDGQELAILVSSAPVLQELSYTHRAQIIAPL